MEIKIGQIWQEVDGHFTRYVRVLQLSAEFDPTHVQIHTVLPETGSWVRAPSTAEHWVLASRFAGKTGGYSYKEG